MTRQVATLSTRVARYSESSQPLSVRPRDRLTAERPSIEHAEETDIFRGRDPEGSRNRLKRDANRTDWGRVKPLASRQPRELRWES